LQLQVNAHHVFCRLAHSRAIKEGMNLLGALPQEGALHVNRKMLTLRFVLLAGIGKAFHEHYAVRYGPNLQADIILPGPPTSWAFLVVTLRPVNTECLSQRARASWSRHLLCPLRCDILVDPCYAAARQPLGVGNAQRRHSHRSHGEHVPVRDRSLRAPKQGSCGEAPAPYCRVGVRNFPSLIPCAPPKVHAISSWLLHHCCAPLLCRRESHVGTKLMLFPDMPSAATAVIDMCPMLTDVSRRKVQLE